MGAFVLNNEYEIIELVTPDVSWLISGENEISGVDNVVKAVCGSVMNGITELVLNQVLTHGREGAVQGILKLENKEISFSHFFYFASASGKRIKKIVSFYVENTNE